MRDYIVVCLMAVVFLLGQATPAFAFVVLKPEVHRLLVLLHVFGAIIFMGNLVVSAMWMSRAKRTADTAVLYFATRSVARADWMFTIPGGILILVPGLLTIGLHGGFGEASWAELALSLFIVTGIIWGAVLMPLQKRMVELTREAYELKLGLADHFYKILARWTMWGGIATLLPLISLYLMVFKPLLWRAGQ